MPTSVLTPANALPYTVILVRLDDEETTDPSEDLFVARVEANTYRGAIESAIAQAQRADKLGSCPVFNYTCLCILTGWQLPVAYGFQYK